MLRKFKTVKKEKTMLEKEIDVLLVEMTRVDRESDIYNKMVKNLEMLYKLKSIDQYGIIDKKTALIVGGNLLGILLILKHEQINVISSKALGFVLRGRA